MNREEILHYKPKNGYKLIYRYFDEDGSYIGQTKKSLKERAGKDGKNYLTYGSKWATAIQEKGYSHFNIEILEECKEIDVDNKEKDFIKKFNSMKNGYNSTIGGKIYFYSHKMLKSRKISEDVYNDILRKFMKWCIPLDDKSIKKKFKGYPDKLTIYYSNKYLIAQAWLVDPHTAPNTWEQYKYVLDKNLKDGTIKNI